MRKNQKGFTLVELIIAIAILAIVALAISGFIVVGSRSYTSANTDIMLQQEAQLALNQISDVIIDTTDSINYSNGAGTEKVLKDSEFSSEPDEKVLVVVNKKDSNNDNDSYRFEWSKTDQIIYFNTSDTVIDDAHPEPVFDDSKKAILAQHVREMHLDISQFEENRVVMVSMTFENGNKEYTTSNNVTVRNRVAINKIDIEPMKKADEFTITTVKNVTLEPGDFYRLPATVTSTATDQDIKWELVDGATTSTISSDGLLNIGTNETRQSFMVKVSRVKEEYANQNNKVAKTVKVNIKRVKGVDLSCSETSIKAGSSVTVNGSANGYMLGNSCEADSCIPDDETKDHDLVSITGDSGWSIVRGPATIESCDKGKAVVKIASSAKKGDEIEIRATSDLTTRKLYGLVQGTYILKLTEGNSGAKFLGSELKFGTDNDPGILDYMRDHLGTDIGHYVYCVRAREVGESDYSKDWVMLYYTMGANERFLPDAFGLDHTKSYEIYFQVLDPRPKDENGVKSRDEASKEEIRNEYLASGSLDSNGKYIGTKFDADEYYYAILNPPAVGVKVDGVDYPNDNESDRDRFVHYIINDGGLGSSVLGEIKPTTAINIDYNTILNSMSYTAYKEENGKWKRIYGVGYDDEQDVEQRKGIERIGALNPETVKKDEYTGKAAQGGVIFQKRSSMTIKRDNPQGGAKTEDACGIYHIVPGFSYKNDITIRGAGGYWDNDDTYIYKHVPGDYNTYYYKQWDAVINVKIDRGLNLQLPKVNGEERWTSFPVPSDRAFPFGLRSETKQEITYSFTSYTKDGQWREQLNNLTVSCEYMGKDKYWITLSSMEVNGRQIITHIYGKYESGAGKFDWEIIDGEKTITETIETNLTFTKDNKQYETYFPTPLEAAFPIDAFNNGSDISNWQLISFNKDGSNDSMIEKCIVKCSKPDNTYTIEIIKENLTNNPHKKVVYNYGTFSWDGSGTWSQIKAGSNTGVDTAVWGTRIYFVYNNNQCMMEQPLPSESGFPSFAESYSESVTLYFFATDTYGDNGQNSWGGIKKEITYDATTGTYTLKLLNGYYSAGEPYGTWTCTAGGTEWIKQ